MIAAAKQDMVAWRPPAIGSGQGSEFDMPVIDIHTHMLTLDWIALLRGHGGDMVGCLARVNALPGDQARQIAGRNAERIFRI